MSRKRLLLFADDGELRAVVGDARPDLRRQAGNYHVVASTPELLILRRSQGEAEGGRPQRVLMAGEIVERSTVLEVINVIASSRWSGTLHVYGVDADRALGFDRGVLRHASSDHPDDRLDKVLFRIGAVSPAQAETLMRDAGPDERFGQVLVDQGIADRRQLFHFLEKQMEQILLEAVLEERGGYLFLVADEADVAPSATAHIPLEQLLFAAAERLDNMAAIRRLIPDDAHQPRVTTALDPRSLSSRDRLVAGHCDGRRSVREIAGETRLGRYETLVALDRLLRAGHAELLPPARSPEQAAAELVAPFNGSLEEIYGSLAGRDLAAARLEIRRWVDGEEGEAIPDGALQGDGLLRGEPIAALLAGGDRRRRMEEVEGALHELVAFALVAASTRLPRSEERDLSRRVHERLRRPPVLAAPAAAPERPVRR